MPNISPRPSRFKNGDHICAIYSTRAELADVASEFLVEGIKRNERCWYIAAGDEDSTVREALQRRRVNVEAETRRDALKIFRGTAAYVVHGAFDPEKTVDLFNNAIEEALNEGFTGFRAAADMSWLLSVNDGARLVIAYEAMLRILFASCRVIGLCLYDRTRMPLKVLNGALVTHPIAGINGDFQQSPFYDPAVTTLPDADATSVVAKLAALQRTKRAH
jgi:hypothetical protein